MLQGSPLSVAEVPGTAISVCTCTAVLTYSALSDPHSHCFQWFPRLGGPRGKHPWQGLSSQTGLALTSRLRAGIGQLLPGWRTKNNWQWSKARSYEVKCHMAIIPFPVYSVYTYQLLLTLRKQQTWIWSVLNRPLES